MKAPFRMHGRSVARSLFATVLLALALPAAALAQKPALDHDAYDRWLSIRGERISPNGAWVLYRLAPRVGDATLVLRARRSREHRVERAGEARFSHDSRFALVTIQPAYDSVRTLRLNRTPRTNLPPDTLAILELATGTVTRLGGVRSWKLPERSGSQVAYTIHRPAPADTALADSTAALSEPAGRPDTATAAPPASGETATGQTLVVRDLGTGTERRFHDVEEYAFDEGGRVVAFTRAGGDDRAGGVYLVGADRVEASALASGPGRYLGLTVAPDGRQVAFLTDRDTHEDDRPEMALWLWSDGREAARPAVAGGAAGLPSGWQVSEHGSLRFSESGRRLFFGTAPRPPREPAEDALLDEERVTLDVWHWRDDHLQPMQLLNVEQERKRTYTAVLHLDRRERVVQLATETMPSVDVGREGDADLALADTDLPYRSLVGIEAPGFSDLWLIDVRTGDRRRVLENRQVAGASLSPDARYLSWYDYAGRQWQGLETARDRRMTLTAGLPYPVWDETDDHPMHPRPYGQAGWTADGRELLVYDRFDIWALDPSGRSTPRRVTEGYGREQGIRFRYVSLDPRELAISRTAPLLLRAFHERNKDAGFFLDRVTGSELPQELVFGPKRYGTPVRAEVADALLYTREDVTEFPDLWVADGRFRSRRKVSNANRQQRDYNWATVERVEWLSTTGVPLQGLLYKPEDFDPARTYPMMVYFYDRQSDDLHQHTPPLPHRSVIRPTFYASRGYIVFMPDIVYQEGYPGKSAMDAVMPGVLKVAAEPWVDRERVGIQGHSWGGYQIAYMITRTNFFRAAGAGAPVANMTSAYGGIRWETGLSRVFQYERTQSRIGGSLWDEPMRYIDNSPLFALDRVETPVLIMHNEDDGHVPWEQGIELFVGLRRLGKPAWLINYNKQPHWPVTAANMRDWNIRMQQFFDHFLQGAPPPVWLVDGIPATSKGRTLGLELLDVPSTADPDDDGRPTGGGGRP